MIPGNAILVKCPYCGTKKELMTIVSGNTFGANYWSDTKRIAPMLPTVSPVQKCPNCGKYYLKYKQQAEEGEACSFNLGVMSYPEWKEAYYQMADQYARHVKDRYIEIDDNDFVNIRFWLIQSFNDYYHRNAEAVPTQEEYEFFCDIVKDFIKDFDWSDVKVPLLKAELYREANEMEKCAEILNSISYDQLKEFEKNIYDGIKERMKKNDNVVFLLY